MSFLDKVEYKDRVPTVLYKTIAYGGTDTLLDNTTPVSSTDGFTQDILLIDDTNVNITFRYITTVDATDYPVFKLYTRDDPVWEIGKDDNIYTMNPTNPGAGNTGIKVYRLFARIHGPGYYRWSLQSSGGTDKFNCLVTVRYWSNKIIGD